MRRSIQTNVPLLINDPFVVRVQFDAFHDEATKLYQPVIRRAYRLTEATWGHSQLVSESVKYKNDWDQKWPPGPRHFEGMSMEKMTACIMNPDWKDVQRGYIAFSEEADALQFILSSHGKCTIVKMWPTTTFTIHGIMYD